jgi:ComF family protein
VRPVAWASDLLDLLLPAGCVVCGAWIPGGVAGSLVCGRCRSRLPRAPWPRCPRCHHPLGTGRAEAARCRECREWPEALAGARFATLLAPPADALVHALKYEGWAELAAEMGRAMAAELRVGREAPSHRRVVVPVPTTAARVRARGYNQAELLARSVAAALDLPFVEALVRTRGGPTQVALPPSQRRANVKGAFALRDGQSARVVGAHVVLVDDVLTTGSTAGAAASELARVGASEITLVVFARAMPLRRDAAR